MLLTRRLGGALQNPLPPLTLVAAISVTAGIALVVNLLAQCFVEHRSSQIVLRWIATICLALIALSVTVPRSAAPAVIIAWFLVVSSEILIWRPRSKTAVRLNRNQTGEAQAALVQQSALPTVSEPALGESPTLESTQQLNYCTVDGRQVVEGWFQIALAANQRVGTAHLAFCPAFDRGPQVDAECTSDVACTIQPALVLPWGIRWEIKLDAPRRRKSNPRDRIHRSRTTDPRLLISNGSLAPVTSGLRSTPTV